ncbi:hypothetical protein BHE74_00024090 [Ensete ventricosum]|nr:hypothetical protein GW17_00018160 [Ensete ventricosum]RWW68403.1 hypothetical protein BHE74_00024090 [Ensete ventricosum]RZS03105.1 hypothetical protein BHM03_00033247 [Ensete ventricosum]
MIPSCHVVRLIHDVAAIGCAVSHPVGPASSSIRSFRARFGGTHRPLPAMGPAKIIEEGRGRGGGGRFDHTWAPLRDPRASSAPPPRVTTTCRRISFVEANGFAY